MANQIQIWFYKWTNHFKDNQTANPIQTFIVDLHVTLAEKLVYIQKDRDRNNKFLSLTSIFVQSFSCKRVSAHHSMYAYTLRSGYVHSFCDEDVLILYYLYFGWVFLL